MKRLICACLALFLLIPVGGAVGAPEVTAKSVVLMEKSTGEVLYAQKEHEKLEPASVTKVMTLLLVMEALKDGSLTTTEKVQVSTRASSMGGSQVYLKEGESMTVEDLLKAVAVVSGNDAAVALAERLCGSESAFVERMNQRAAELGMKDTTFCNCTGLPAQGHLTSAYDIALMSRELILHHPDIRSYTTIWMDTLRDGTFQLSNTNKLVRFYEGCTGLKTGSTDGAGYCLSATAQRDGMELIAVVLGSATSAERFNSARSMLDHGFANYTLLTVRPEVALPPLDVELGKQTTVQPVLEREPTLLLERSQAGKVTSQVVLPEQVSAPVEMGQALGELQVFVDGVLRENIPLVADVPVPRLTLWEIFQGLLGRYFCCAEEMES